ncbi:MAG TPA: ADP-ribosylglycohydrolase family protein [Methanomicrobiales archaeon]|nr:ADP-ribosylglycohydrolase family protein [Methanomicrobiales archaeon]
MFILQEERAVGVLLGLAVGDALGAPLEGLPPPSVPVRDLPAGGSYTDDTLQAMAVARSLVVSRGFSPEDCMARLLDGYRRYPEFYGPTSSGVFALVLEGVPARDAALQVHRTLGGSRSNGSVMRGPPLGIFTASPVLEEMSLACSRLTHCDPVAGACSAFVNRMIASLAREASRGEAFRLACSTCRSGEVLSMLGEYRKNPRDPSLDALLATHCALSVFMESASFAEAVLGAVNMGGDADTIGAITGALAGAAWGAGAVPPLWRVNLKDHDRIIELAGGLYRVAVEKGE